MKFIYEKETLMEKWILKKKDEIARIESKKKGVSNDSKTKRKVNE